MTTEQLTIYVDLAFDSMQDQIDLERKHNVVIKFNKSYDGADEYLVKGTKENLKAFIVDWDNGNDEAEEFYPELFE